MDRYPQNLGFTIMELLITILIGVILLTLAAPSFNELYQAKQLAKAGENLYADMLSARSEAIKRQTSLFVNVNVNTLGAWCYGFNVGSDCNCTLAGSCQINGNSTIVTQSLYPKIQLASSMGNSSLQFEGIRGTSNKNVTLTLSQASKTINILINDLGVARICSANLADYQRC